MTDPQEIEVRGERSVAAPAQPSPMEILAQAVQDGKVDAESIKVIAELAWKDQDRNARREFNQRLARVRKCLPEIKKTTPGPVLDRKGSGEPAYWYAKLEHLEPQVRGPLIAEGFSYSWDTQISEAILTATFILRHENGHEERFSFSCPTDSPAPQMSLQQKYGGARSYAMRKSMEQGLGIVEVGADNDGAGGTDPVETITPEQAANLEAWADSLGVDTAGFLKWIPAESFEAIPASKFAKAEKGLKARQEKQS